MMTLPFWTDQPTTDADGRDDATDRLTDGLIICITSDGRADK